MLARDFNGIFASMHTLVEPHLNTGMFGPVKMTKEISYMKTGKGFDTVVMWKELPGVKAKDIEIEVDALSSTLHLKVSSKNSYFSTEIDTRQTISMDADLDAEVETVLEDGILTLTFPIKASAKPRKLEVKAIN